MLYFKNEPNAKTLILIFSFLVLVIINSFVLIIKKLNSSSPITEEENSLSPSIITSTKPSTQPIIRKEESNNHDSHIDDNITNTQVDVLIQNEKTEIIQEYTFQNHTFGVLIEKENIDPYIYPEGKHTLIKNNCSSCKLTENDEKVMDFPANNLNYLKYIEQDDTLYLSFSHFFGGLTSMYRITNSYLPPEFVFDAKDGGSPQFINSNVWPSNKLKYIMHTADFNTQRNLYYYLPHKNYAEIITDEPSFIYIGISQDDSIIMANYLDIGYGKSLQFKSTIKEIIGFKVDPENFKINTFTILNNENLPNNVKQIFLNHKKNKLFIVGDDIYTFDLATKEFSLFLNLHQFIVSQLDAKLYTSITNISNDIFFDPFNPFGKNQNESQEEYYTVSSSYPDELILELLRSNQKYLINLDTKEITQVE